MRIKKVYPKSRGQILPCVLTIAGSDSGGGAGIQADLKTFSAIGVHGVTAITCLTAQNPLEVRAVYAVPPATVHAQIETVLDVLAPQVVKTGMLYSREIILCVEKTLHRGQLLIIDPVMISTSGALLLRPSALTALKSMFRRASLVTPNLHEAEHLLGRKLVSPEDLRAAAREIHELYGCAALVKGGHLSKTKVAIDFLFDGKSEWVFEAPFIRNVSTHGTGCTYSAAIAAYLALGKSLPRAVGRAKEFISNAIALSTKTNGHFVLNFNWGVGRDAVDSSLC